MKKTININIGGHAFVIDEDAYEILESYMNDLDSHFERHPGKEEIMSDIEVRVGELLGEEKGGRDIVERSHVLNVIATLGKTDQFESEEEEIAEDPRTTRTGKKKLYRDRDNKVIAGVCAGIAAYFNIDVVIVRILFVVAASFGGGSLLLYLLLWIIAPYAVSASDRLHMRGERITIESIAKDVEKGLDKLGNVITDLAQKIDKNKANLF